MLKNVLEYTETRILFMLNTQNHTKMNEIPEFTKQIVFFTYQINYLS